MYTKNISTLVQLQGKKINPKSATIRGADFQVMAKIFLLNRNCFLRIKEIHTLPDLEREG